MAEIIERLTGENARRFSEKLHFSLLGMQDTMYRPARKLWPQIAPTEIDNNLRHRLVQAKCTMRTRLLLAAFRGMRAFSARHRTWRVLPDAAERRRLRAPENFAARDYRAIHDAAAAFRGTRTLGWAVPTEGGSSGHYFSAHSFGAHGITGTSIWIDPTGSFLSCLLTNRVHPTRKENTKIQQVRVALA